MELVGYNVEGSLFGRVHVTIRMELMENLKIKPISEIDKTNHNLDTQGVRLALRVYVKENLEDVIEKFGVDTSDCIILKEKEVEALKVVYGKTDEEIRGILGDEKVKELNEKGKEMYGELVLLDNPTSVEDLTELLNKYVLRITYKKKNGEVTDVDVTNNEKQLEVYLGEDYVQTYESKRKKYVKMLEKLESGEDFGILAVEYGYVGERSKEKVEEAIEELTKKGASKIEKGKEQGYVSTRKYNPSNQKSVFAQIGINSIVSVQKIK